MVLMPPGSAKSTYGSVLFPPWWFANHPASAVIAVSHTGRLAAHFGRRARDTAAEHPLVLNYGISADARAAAEWCTDKGGSYYAAGVRGPVTGRRADLILIDDPVKSHAEADSASVREHVWNWYRSDLLTRLKPGGRIVLIMTRWHEDDLGGRLLADAASGGDTWRCLRLSALADEDDPLGRAPGEALWPEWEDAAMLARKRAAVGERAWASLYQQSLRPLEGALFKAQVMPFVDAAPTAVQAVRAWDLAATAQTGARNPDWTAGVLLVRDARGSFAVADVVRLQGGPMQVEDAIARTAEMDGRGVAIALPQDPGQAGRTQVAYLTRRLAGFVVTASPETGAKTTRAMPVAAQVEAGNVALVRGTWNRAFVDELLAFPFGSKDDQVDALSRAFAVMTERGAAARRLDLSITSR
jgi:predicted phage terminase large subunit-like protein